VAAFFLVAVRSRAALAPACGGQTGGIGLGNYAAVLTRRGILGAIWNSTWMGWRHGGRAGLRLPLRSW